MILVLRPAFATIWANAPRRFGCSKTRSAADGGRDGQARLRFAYANLLAATGRWEAAREWLVSASDHDDQDALGVGEAIAGTDGVAVTDDVLDD